MAGVGLQHVHRERLAAPRVHQMGDAAVARQAAADADELQLPHRIGLRHDDRPALIGLPGPLRGAGVGVGRRPVHLEALDVVGRQARGERLDAIIEAEEEDARDGDDQRRGQATAAPSAAERCDTGGERAKGAGCSSAGPAVRRWRRTADSAPLARRGRGRRVRRGARAPSSARDAPRGRPARGTADSRGQVLRRWIAAPRRAHLLAVHVGREPFVEVVDSSGCRQGHAS